MEESEHSLVPQWLKSSGSVSRVANIKSQLTSSQYSDHITYSGYRRSSSNKGPGFSRSYSSSGRSWHDREWEKDIDNFIDKEKLCHGEYNHDHSDYVDKILSKRFEKDLLRHSQSMNSGRWKENRSPRTSGDVSNPQRNHGKSDGMVVGIMDKTLFEEEFPLLGAEDKHGNSESGKVLSPSSSTYSLFTGTSSVIVSNGLSSPSDATPMTVGSSSMAVMMHQHTDSASTYSMTSGTVGLSMAETLAQGPSRSHTPPQLSVDAQKLEELALKQSRLLIPMTPSTPRSLVASPSEKSKVKTGQQQYPSPYSRSPGNLDMQKIGSGNSRNVSASRELNVVSLAAKEDSSPSRSRVVLSPTGASTSTAISPPSRGSNNNSTPSVRMTLEKRPTFQTQSRSDFFKNLSRKSSSKDPCSDVCPNGMPCALEKSQAGTSNTPCSLNPSTDESSCVISENGGAASKDLRFSSKAEQQHSANPILNPDEEIAFLHSLGWEESAGEDEGLTEEEIQDFYEKYLKLQSSPNIRLHQNTLRCHLTRAVENVVELRQAGDHLPKSENYI